MPFGYKFGSSFAYAVELIDMCKELNVHLEGISFHVGSGCYDPQAYVDTIRSAKRLFDYSESIGMPLRFLDLGGVCSFSFLFVYRYFEYNIMLIS